MGSIGMEGKPWGGLLVMPLKVGSSYLDTHCKIKLLPFFLSVFFSSKGIPLPPGYGSMPTESHKKSVWGARGVNSVESWSR